ncbi:MAG: CbrC family protein [Lachnospiraceae bacterium]|nr:CbrC family protein [Lachnospiraceae bacterium]
MIDNLPKFKYHPNLYNLGIVKFKNGICNCCGKITNAYIQNMYTSEEIDCICLKCVSNGEASKKFDGEFVQDAEKISDKDKIDELFRRTPGYISWQGEHWLACCDDYCEYIGTVGISELNEMNISEEVFKEFDNSGLSSDFCESLKKDGSPCGYLFRCLHCGKYRIWIDAV